MTLTPYPVPQFAGLNLVDDPEEAGAIKAVDLLNVDFGDRGRVRSRDGTTNFTFTTPPAVNDYVTPFYTANGGKNLIGVAPSNTNTEYKAYNANGTVAVSSGVLGPGGFAADSARFGGSGAESIYVTSHLSSVGIPSIDIIRWNGVGWFAATGCRLGGAGVYPYALEVKAGDNRLVGAFETSQSSRVGFSNPDAPETWDSTNWVDLTPGDGESIRALVSWREMVFAFKETKFFVFGATSTGNTGNPLFNYRPVSGGVGATGRSCAVSSPNGVYFFSRRGIYLTTGGDPTLISRELDPLFTGGSSLLFTGGELNHAAIDKCAMTWSDERLFFAYPAGTATVNTRVLVYDPKIDYWTLWDLPAARMCAFRVDDREELIYSRNTGSTHIDRFSSAYTTDSGTAITSRYQSGFYEPSPGAETTTRWTKLWGMGAPRLDIFTDHATTDPLSRGGTVTLGTDPQVARGYHLKSYKGELYSHKLSATSPWSLNRLEHDIANAFQPA